VAQSSQGWKRENKLIFKEGVGLKVEALVSLEGKEPARFFMVVKKDEVQNLYTPSGNTTFRIDLATLRKEFGEEVFKEIIDPMVTQDIRKPFSFMGIKKEDAIFEDIGKINGQEMLIFNSHIKVPIIEENKVLSQKIKIWIGSCDNLLHKYTLYDQESNEMYAETFTDIVINPEISDKEFDFKPPGGTKIIDQTENFIKRYRLILRQ